MKSIVLFHSFLGATKQYANWLKEELNCDLNNYLIKDEKLKEFELVIIMSGTYIGWMPLVEFLKNRWEKLRGKKVIVISVGIVPKTHEDSIKSYSKIPEDIRKKIKYFKIPGRIGDKTTDFKRENLNLIIEYIKKIQIK